MRLGGLAIALLAVTVTSVSVLPASASSPQLAGLVGAGPVTWTPNVSAGTTVGQAVCNGTYFGAGSLNCQSEVHLSFGNALLPVTAATAKTPFGVIPSGLFNTEGGSSTAAPMCLDDPANSTSTGTAVDIANCVNQAQQYWTVPATGTTGQVKINDLCLDVSGGTNVVLATCLSNPNGTTQQWTQGSGNTVINVSTGQCLDDPDGNIASGTALDIATCTGGQNQIWPLPTAPGPAAGPPNGPVYPQQTQGNTQQPCLDDAGDSTTAGNKVQLWTCRGDAAQVWSAVPVTGGDNLKLGTSATSVSCLDTSAGGNVVLNPCDGGSDQAWRIPGW